MLIKGAVIVIRPAALFEMFPAAAVLTMFPMEALWVMSPFCAVQSMFPLRDTRLRSCVAVSVWLPVDVCAVVCALTSTVAPGALTRLTEDTKMSDELRRRYDPRWVAPVVTWLASSDSADITGQVIESNGMVIAIAEGWHRGPSDSPPAEPGDVGTVVRRLVADSRPSTRMAETV